VLALVEIIVAGKDQQGGLVAVVISTTSKKGQKQKKQRCSTQFHISLPVPIDTGGKEMVGIYKFFRPCDSIRVKRGAPKQ
jgi:hypothetical protein